jgi:hypothetical protein
VMAVTLYNCSQRAFPFTESWKTREITGAARSD